MDETALLIIFGEIKMRVIHILLIITGGLSSFVMGMRVLIGDSSNAVSEAVLESSGTANMLNGVQLEMMVPYLLFGAALLAVSRIPFNGEPWRPLAIGAWGLITWGNGTALLPFLKSLI